MIRREIIEIIEEIALFLSSNRFKMTQHSPRFMFDRSFLSWFKETRASLAISSLSPHQIHLIGLVMNLPTDKEKTDSPAIHPQLSMWLTSFTRPMTLALGSDGTLGFGTLFDIQLYTPFREQKIYDGYQPLEGTFSHYYYLNQLHKRNGIGSTDFRDLHITTDQLYFIAPMMNSVLVESRQTYRRQVYWTPPWITNELSSGAEDRCHLSGLCCLDGEPKFVTSFCRQDYDQGWSGNIVQQGVVYDLQRDECLCEGLTGPVSPRWYQDQLWILESGTGWLGVIDLESKRFKKRVFLPGICRGLSFIDHYAVVGCSKNLNLYYNNCEDLPLVAEIEKRGESAKTALYIIDLEYDKIIHTLEYHNYNIITDVLVIPNCQRPTLDYPPHLSSELLLGVHNILNNYIDQNNPSPFALGLKDCPQLIRQKIVDYLTYPDFSQIFYSSK